MKYALILLPLILTTTLAFGKTTENEPLLSPLPGNVTKTKEKIKQKKAKERALAKKHQK